MNNNHFFNSSSVKLKTMNTLERLQTELNTVMCADTAGIVVSYLDYRIPVDEVKERMNKVIDSLNYGAFDDDSFGDPDKEVKNTLNVLFKCDYLCCPRDFEFSLVGDHMPYSNFDRYLSINERLTLPTSDMYVHPHKREKRLHMTMYDQLILRKVLKEVREKFNQWKLNRVTPHFTYVYRSKNRFVPKFYCNAGIHDIEYFDQLINDWDYKRPYYIHKKLENTGLPPIDFRYQMERVYLNNDLTQYFMNMDLKRFVSLRGIDLVQKVNNKSVKIGGKNRMYREVSADKSRYTFYQFHSKIIHRAGFKYAKPDSMYTVIQRQVCIDRKWTDLESL